jgi:hypothetical protein
MKIIKTYEGFFDKIIGRDEDNKSEFSAETQTKTAIELTTPIKNAVESMEKISKESKEFNDVKRSILEGNIQKVGTPVLGYKSFKAMLNDGRTIEISHHLMNDFGSNWHGEEIIIKGHFIGISDSSFDSIRESQKTIIEPVKMTGIGQGKSVFMKKEGYILISKEDYTEILNYLTKWHDDKDNEYKSKLPKRDFNIEDEDMGMNMDDKAKERLRLSAFTKLTPEERRALGI